MTDIKHTFVNFQAGSGGEFILSLLMLMNSPQRQLTVSDFGSCHTNRHHEKEFTAGGVHDMDIQTALNNFQLDNQYPLYKAHVSAQDIEKFCNHFIDCIVFYILPCTRSVDQVVRNIWHKVIVQERKFYGKDRLAEEMKYAGLPVKRDPYILTKSEFDIVYQSMWRRVRSIVQKSHNLDLPNLILIDFYDLMHSKHKVLDIISTNTNRVVNQRTDLFYDEYLSKQPTKNDIYNFREKLDG